MTNRERIEQLLLESQPALRRLAFKLYRNPSQAEDLVQTASLRALERADTCKTFEIGWLTTILWRRFLDEIQAADFRLPHDDIEDTELPAPRRARLSWWRLVTDEQLARAVRELPDEFRLAWELFEIEGLGQEEIARRLGIKPPTVATRVRRARERLRELLQQMLATE